MAQPPEPRSSAWPLAWAFIGLIIYASLHPFAGWRLTQPAGPWLLELPWSFFNPRWDIASNLVAYIPLGLLSCTAWRRDGESAWVAALASCAVGSGLSYAMEVTQHLLPTRVPSLLDWLLNTSGTAIGAVLALAMHRLRWVERMRSWRNRWFLEHSGVGQTLLLLWPLGLLFPLPVPLGTGQVLDLLNGLLADLLVDTPYTGWIPQRAQFEPLSLGAEMLTVALGLLAPALVAGAIARTPAVRLLMLVGAALLGALGTTLSTALNFGPEHGLSWITLPVGPGFALGLLLGLACAWLPRRALAGVALVCLTALVALVNDAPADPYYALSLLAWEQGRFIRFHGLAQWIGWLWPYLALAWLLARRGLPDGEGQGRLPTMSR